ncbi:hypothetical protein PbJCM13498_23280 [Prolixibacter bellariivorans]|uniref:Uncharacterized protein n=1 Tax=Prolixibacter bellariivorans TaxID=314319 RepID=A0A5M4B008_9BACT|nr:hypothetical protein [Prolixibacter bellariivorans]GET33465.1 hypothetical protein PbJCM13498_23280 [Prolixibacter bellariivorans]
MWSQFLRFFLVFGVPFGVIAGIMVYLITYSEMVKHYPEKDYPRKLALKSALTAMAFFLLVGGIIGIFVMKE